MQQIRVGAVSPDAILPGHRRAPQWVPTRTPTVHWGPNSRKAVGGPFGSDSRYTANINPCCPQVFLQSLLSVSVDPLVSKRSGHLRDSSVMVAEQA